MVTCLSLFLAVAVTHCYSSSLPSEWIVMSPSTDADQALSISFLRAAWLGPINEVRFIATTAFGGQANFDVGRVQFDKYEFMLPFKTAYDKIPPVCIFEFDATHGWPQVPYITRVASQRDQVSVYVSNYASQRLLWSDMYVEFCVMCYGPRSIDVAERGHVQASNTTVQT